MTESDDTAPSGEMTEDERRDAIMRRLVANTSTRFARELIDNGVDRVAVVRGLRDACEAIRDDALAEIEPEGHA